MIKLVTSEAFEAYGRVLFKGESVHNDPLFQDFITKTTQISRRSSKFRYSLKHPIYLENDGKPVLLFLSPDASFKCKDIFLLDKPVVLNTGVLFSLTSFENECHVKSIIPKGAIYREFTAPDGGTESFEPHFNVNKIHTVFYQKQETGFMFKGESHDFWELTYMDKGYMHTDVDGEQWVLNQGEAMFYDKGQYHTQYADKDVACRYITITFSMDLADSGILRDRKFKIDSGLSQLLEKILYENEENFFFSEELISCYLKEFLIMLCRIYMPYGLQRHGPANTSIEHEIVNRAASFIRDHSVRRLTVSEIAAHVNVSQSYLSVLFKKHKKFTLIEYIGYIRLERSKELLREWRYSITEIAEMVGYSSVHYMSRQFKKVIGMSPTEYMHTQRDKKENTH